MPFERHPVDRDKPPNILGVLAIAVLLVILLLGCETAETEVTEGFVSAEGTPEAKVTGYIGICLIKGDAYGCDTASVSYQVEKQQEACEVSMWTAFEITKIILGGNTVFKVYVQCVAERAPPPDWWLFIRAWPEQERDI